MSRIGCDSIRPVRYRDLLHRVDSTTENWTGLDLEDKENIVTACEDMRNDMSQHSKYFG